MESFLRGNLQVQFGGRRASTQPYEYSDYNSSDEQSLTFDSYMIPEDDLELGQLRLLEVDNRVVVPAKTHIRIIVTSADVLHSWAVPSLGVKGGTAPHKFNWNDIFPILAVFVAMGMQHLIGGGGAGNGFLSPLIAECAGSAEATSAAPTANPADSGGAASYHIHPPAEFIALIEEKMLKYCARQTVNFEFDLSTANPKALALEFARERWPEGGMDQQGLKSHLFIFNDISRYERFLNQFLGNRFPRK